MENRNFIEVFLKNIIKSIIEIAKKMMELQTNTQILTIFWNIVSSFLEELINFDIPVNEYKSEIYNTYSNLIYSKLLIEFDSLRKQLELIGKDNFSDKSKEFIDFLFYLQNFVL